METTRRAVLERVARGELSPTEAASLLEEMESKESREPEADPRDWAAGWAQEAGWESPPAPAPAPSGEGVARLRVVRSIGTTDIIGDPSVREAVAEGPHVARREGDTLIIEGQDEYSLGMPGFFFNNWAGSWQGEGRGRGRGRRMHRHPGFGWGDMTPLRVRVNPDLPLEVDAQAGRVRIRGVHGPIRANVQAGSTDIVDFRGTLDLNAQAGSLSARGRLDHGASRIHCDAGSVRIHLERGSSVRVTGRSTLGKVVFDSPDARSPWVVGGGEGTLDIDATMGAVRVMAD
jgi:hypothetical protein